MFAGYVRRGMKAGVVGGMAFGGYVALVSNPLIGYIETFESGGNAPVVSVGTTNAVSIVGAVLIGILLGAVVFGFAYYVLEPVLPGSRPTASYLLGAAGFITVSGAPWLVLPPQPPGVQQALPVETRVALYLGMMIAGGIACAGSLSLFGRLRDRGGRRLGLLGALTPFGALVLIAILAPANPVSGPVPAALAAVYRAVTAAGQVGLWVVLSSAHVWLAERGEPRVAGDRSPANDHRTSVPTR